MANFGCQADKPGERDPIHGIVKGHGMTEAQEIALVKGGKTDSSLSYHWASLHEP